MHGASCLEGEMWRNPNGLADIEHALDNHSLFVRVNADRYWRARRNGKTQTWKRDKTRFRIPVKYGLYGYGAIEQTTDNSLMRIAESMEKANG